MLKIVAKFIVKEDKIEEFKKYAEELAIETRKEEGSISYHLLQNIDDSKLLIFIEEWENQEAIDKHNKSKHFVSILPKLTEHLESDPVIITNKVLL